MVYSLPLIKRLGGGVLHLKPQNNYNQALNNFKTMRPLLEAQDCITEVVEYPLTEIGELDPDIHIDHDLDRFRLVPNIARHNLVAAYFKAFGIQDETWRGKPWLQANPWHPGDIVMEDTDDVFGNKDQPFVRVNRTERYQDPKAVEIWERTIWELKDAMGLEVYFVGLEREYIQFINMAYHMHYIPTSDALQLARLVQAADRIYCNQSLVLTLAQALGRPYWLEVAPGHTNTIMNTSNEHILNP